MSIDQLYDPNFPGTTEYVPINSKKSNVKSDRVHPQNKITYHQFSSKTDNNTGKQITESITGFAEKRLRHRAQGQKDGPAIVGGEFIPFKSQSSPQGKPYSSGRRDEFVRSISFIQIDVDNTDKQTKTCLANPITAERIESWLKKNGYLGFYYTTFSHTCEWPRYRIVLFFDQPFKIRDELNDPKGADRADLYERGYAALAQSLCGDDWDHTCKNLSRIFYLPAYPSNDVDAQRAAVGKLIEGQQIDFEKIIAELPAKVERSVTRQRKAEKTPAREKFGRMFRAVCRHFAAADFVCRHEESAREKSAGKCEFFCPFNDEHGHPDGTDRKPAVAFNPEEAKHETATVACRHDACRDRTAEDFIFAIWKRENLGLDDLLEFLDDRGAEIFTAKLTEFEPGVEEIDDAIAAVKRADRKAIDDAAFAAIKIIARLVPSVDSARAVHVLAEAWGKSESKVEKLISDERKAKRQLAKRIAVEPAEDDPREIFPNVDFDSALSKATQLLEEGNAANPYIFYSPFRKGYVRISARPEDASLDHLDSSAKWAHELRKHVKCMHRAKSGRTYSIAPPKTLIDGIHGNPELLVPTCQNVIRVPQFGADCKLRTDRGYDSATKSFLIPWGSFRPLPEEVNEDHVLEARQLLMLALRDFPFSDNFVGVDPLPVRNENEFDEESFPAPNILRGKSSRAHALAMLLTPIVRNMISGPTPIHFIDKPKPGTGAGFLLDLLFHIFEGRRASVFALGLSEEERAKQITTKLAAGKAIIAADNINHHVDDAALAAAISGGHWEGRRLGTNQDIEVAINATFVFTCNTGSLSQELMERVLPIRMDAALDNPASERPPEYFKVHSLGYSYGEWLEATKIDLVWSLHVIAAWWRQKCGEGYCYEGAIHPRFLEYSRVIGGILEEAKIEGFAANLPAYLATRNDERGAHREALQLLFTLQGEKPFSAADAAVQLVDGNNRLRFDILPRERSDRRRTAEGLDIAIGRWLSSMAAEAVHSLPNQTTVGFFKTERNGSGMYHFEKR